MATKKKSPDWFEKGAALLEKIVKRSRNKKAALIVLSQSGDLVLRAGDTKKFDFTSIGALTSALLGLQHQLDKMTSISSGRIVFSPAKGKKEYWVEAHKNWLIIGLQLSQKTDLKDLKKHLNSKTAPKLDKPAGKESLDGLSEAGIEAALQS